MRAFAGALVAAALVVAPLVTAGATAAEPMVGTVGTIEPASAKANGEAYWEARYDQFDAQCYKHGNERNDHGAVTNNGKTVTLSQFQDSWPGDQWVVLIVKGATSNNVIENPKAGVAYASPLTKAGGPQSDVSHWIVCKGTVPTTTPTLVTPRLTYTPPSCDAAGSLTRGDGVKWDSEVNDDGTTTWIATPLAGTAFPAGTVATWTVRSNLAQLAEGCEPELPVKPEPVITDRTTEKFDCNTKLATVTTITTTTDHTWDEQAEKWVLGTPVDSEPVVTTRALTPAEQATCPPDTTVERTEWKDGVWACGDTVVTQTREVSTTTYTLEGEGPAVPSTTKVTETQTRPLTQAEIGETCDLVPGEIQSVCVGDVPYLGYAVSLPEGFVADSANPVTITFVNPDGEDYVVEDQPLSGKLLWPGASDGNPKMWPGWDLVDGEYVQTDGNFAWTRAGVTVEFEVNPTYTTEVEYPQATALCANPPVGSGDEPAGTPTSTDAEALAVTGGGVSPIIVAAGGTALLAGIAVVAIVAYRRRHASMQ
ncbi:hypothetical protein ACI3KY_02740 [Microbacterium sp. ZW T2_14]|uniref:hypothetical protein n=1 Tax=Microbacterium sp. ZW T2_14 TaxID=3378079 RepID=UPI003854C15E